MPKSIYRLLQLVLLLISLFFFSGLVAYQVTRSGEMLTVPDFAGKTMEEARQEISGRKMSVAQSGVSLHDIYEQGRIFQQEPPADAKVKLNTTIRVLVSAGREKVIVPDLIGRTLEMISPTLQEAGVRKGKIAHVHTSRYAAGKIISQSPIAGREVGSSSRISLLVSQGERQKQYLMPDLMGKRLSLVLSQLKRLEFRVGDIRRQYYPGLESGLIINQNPKPGDRIQKNNIIRLEVSR
jgi:serine/threonine-protein kinase